MAGQINMDGWWDEARRPRSHHTTNFVYCLWLNLITDIHLSTPNFFLLSPKLHTHGLPHRILNHHFRTSIDEIINIAAAAGVTTEDDEDEEADDDESSEEGSADRLLVF